MRQYWQRKPLLIRSALQGFAPPIDRKRLFELARDPHAESRLITLSRGRRSLQHGPFRRLPSIQRAGWTLLVQGVDLLDDAGQRAVVALSIHTRCAARRPDGELRDGWRRRRAACRLIRRLSAASVWPPAVARQPTTRIARSRPRRSATSKAFVHRVNGCWTQATCFICRRVSRTKVSRSASGMTYSIGFRAPGYQQLIEPWFADYAEHANLRGRYADRWCGSRCTSRRAASDDDATRSTPSSRGTGLARRTPSAFCCAT